MTQDPQALKQQQKEMWKTSAAAWKRNDERIRRTAAPVTEKMFECAGLALGHRVLDIASGTGEPGLPAAQMVGPDGSVLLTDISNEMLDIARQKARDQGIANVEFRVVDGESQDLGEDEFDAAICRFGVMFMPDPLRCLSAVNRALVSGGRAVFATWAAPELNPFLAVAMPVLAKYLDVPPPNPSEPGPFAFADQNNLVKTFEDAGFRDVTVDEVHITSEFDSGREYWQSTREVAGPIAKLFQQVPDDMKDKVADEIASAASGAGPESSVSLKGTALVAVGTK